MEEIAIGEQFFRNAFPMSDSARFSSHFRGQMQILRCLFNLMEAEELGNSVVLEKIEYCLNLMIELNEQVFANDFIESVNIKMFLASVARCLERLFGGVEFRVESHDECLSSNKAFYIGLLLPELLEGQYGSVGGKCLQEKCISFAVAQGCWCLTIPAVEMAGVKIGGYRFGSDKYNQILSRSLIEQLEARLECQGEAIKLFGKIGV